VVNELDHVIAMHRCWLLFAITSSQTCCFFDLLYFGALLLRYSADCADIQLLARLHHGTEASKWEIHYTWEQW